MHPSLALNSVSHRLWTSGPPFSKCRDYEHVLPWPISVVLRIEPRASCMLNMYELSSVTSPRKPSCWRNIWCWQVSTTFLFSEARAVCWPMISKHPKLTTGFAGQPCWRHPSASPRSKLLSLASSLWHDQKQQVTCHNGGYHQGTTAIFMGVRFFWIPLSQWGYWVWVAQGKSAAAPQPQDSSQGPPEWKASDLRIRNSTDIALSGTSRLAWSNS